MVVIKPAISHPQLLAAGWKALESTDWEAARSSFESAVATKTTAEGLEGLAVAAWWLDDATTMFSARERAYRLYRRRGDHLSAGRLATLLGIDYFQFRGEAAVGNGWFRRAHRLLEGLHPSSEHGWLLIWEGQCLLQGGNDPATAGALGTQAAELGRTLGSVDIEMTGLGLEGLALVAQGATAEGMSRLDEATAAAVAGEMSIPNAIGATCCYLIYACERVRDYERALQWCRRVEDFCREVRWTSLFATCRTHYAGVLMWQGAWTEAESELVSAIRQMQATRPGDLAHGLVRLAELRRRQGRLEESRRLLADIDFDPHALLGLAAVALEHEHPAEARQLVERALRRIPQDNRTDRAAALELGVRAEAASGSIDHGRVASEELRLLAESIATDPVKASAAAARGVIAAAAGDHLDGLDAFEEALEVFVRTGLPFEEAQTRLQIARVLVDLGQTQRAVEEARRAHDKFVALGAVLEVRRSASMLRTLGVSARERSGRGAMSGLSARELEVLELVAHGYSNRRIAEDLIVSEHTVRRHVANILKKLGVPSRAAAAAQAARLQLY